MRELNLIFVGGVPRSGTSLVQKILDIHSQIYAGPEFDHLPGLCRIYHDMKKGIANGRQEFYYDESKLKDACADFIGALLLGKAQRKKVNFLCEKTPANVLVFNELNEIFPQARFVFVIRDPRGNISSFKKVAAKAKAFGDRVHLGHNLFSDLNLINQYIQTGEAFYQHNKGRCYLLQYERLLNKPEQEVRNLCAFIGIDYQPRMLELGSHQNDSSKLINSEHPTVRAWSTPGMLDAAINPAAAENWVNDLDKREVQIIDNFFAQKNYECYGSYNLSKPKKMSKVSLIPYYIKNLGTRYLLNKAIGRLKSH